MSGISGKMDQVKGAFDPVIRLLNSNSLRPVTTIGVGGDQGSIASAAESSVPSLPKTRADTPTPDRGVLYDEGNKIVSQSGPATSLSYDRSSSCSEGNDASQPSDASLDKTPGAARAASPPAVDKRSKKKQESDDEESSSSESAEAGYLSSGDEKKVEKKAAAAATAIELVKTTPKQAETFTEIYKALTEGPLQELLDVTESWAVVRIVGKHCLLWKGIFSNLKTKGELIRKEVHPLAFLLLLQRDAAIKEYIKKIASQDYRDKWGAKIGKLTKWIGQDNKSPWEHTWGDLGEDIQFQQRRGSFPLEKFLEDLPEEKRKDAKEYIKEAKWEDLLQLMIR